MRQTPRMKKAGGRIRTAVRDIVVPTSLGLGLALAGCSGTEAAATDGAADKTDAAKVDQQVYAIMPPMDSGAQDTAKPDTAKPDGQVYAILPPTMDSGAQDTAKPDGQVYAILPPHA